MQTLSVLSGSDPEFDLYLDTSKQVLCGPQTAGTDIYLISSLFENNTGIRIDINY